MKKIPAMLNSLLVCTLFLSLLGAPAPANAAPQVFSGVQPLAPLPPEGSPGNENWAGGFELGALSGTVYALAPDGSNLYVGGNFLTAEGETTYRVARWNGSAWSSLGAADYGFNHSVYALAVDASGNVYAGGEFTAVCTSDACATTRPGYNRMARWNGSAWEKLGAGYGFNLAVRSLAVDASGSVYAGGDFTALCSNEACSDLTLGYNRLAKWSSGAWGRLGTNDWGFSSRVRAVLVDSGGSVYAGGDFETRCSDAACSEPISGYNSFAMWNASGSDWSVPGGIDGDAVYGFNSSVYALAVDSSGSLYVGGNFNVVCMNETCSTTTAGFNSLAQLAGTTWSGLEDGVNNSVYALALDADNNLYAGGAFTRLCKKGDCSSTIAGYNRIARWDGSAWSTLGADDLGFNGDVYALAVITAANVYAAGLFTSLCRDDPACTLTAPGYNRIARWNGLAWNAVGNSVTGFDSAVSSLALDGSGNLYAGGQFTSVGTARSNYIARWNGSAWSALGYGLNEAVSALAFGSGNLYVGGAFTLRCKDIYCSTSEPGYNHVAYWDGTAWWPLGYGFNGPVKALALDSSGNLYAGGEFTRLCRNAACTGASAESGYNGLARWNSSIGDWETLGAADLGFNEPVQALAFDSAGSLYAGGDFNARCSDTDCTTTIPGFNGLAKWDISSSSWSTLGATDYGFNTVSYKIVSVLKFDSLGNLYAGGAFTARCTDAGCTPGGQLAGYNRLARWNVVAGAWETLGAADLGFNGAVKTLAFDSAGSLYAGGAFSAICTDTACGSSTPGYARLARWNGAAWQSLGSGLDSDVNALAFYSSSGRLYAGGSFTRAGGQPSSYFGEWTAAAGQCGVANSTNYTLYAGNLPVEVYVNMDGKGTLDCVTIQRFNRDHPNMPVEFQSGYYWSIRGLDSGGSPATGFNVRLTLPYATANATSLVCRYNTGVSSWECGLSDFVAGASVTLNHVTAFSDWQPSPGTPTAVTMVGFEAQAHTGLVQLTWQTALELDMLGFNVYRSDSLDGERLRVNAALIPAQGLGSLEGASYVFTDFSPSYGTAAYYWLEVLNLDGPNEWFGPLQAQAGYGAWFPMVVR